MGVMPTLMLLLLSSRSAVGVLRTREDAAARLEEWRSTPVFQGVVQSVHSMALTSGYEAPQAAVSASACMQKY